jgi:hypothetical protein
MLGILGCLGNCFGFQGNVTGWGTGWEGFSGVLFSDLCRGGQEPLIKGFIAFTDKEALSLCRHLAHSPVAGPHRNSRNMTGAKTEKGWLRGCPCLQSKVLRNWRGWGGEVGVGLW